MKKCFLHANKSEDIIFFSSLFLVILLGKKKREKSKNKNTITEAE